MVDIVNGIVYDSEEELEMYFQYFLQHKPDCLKNLTDEQINNVLNNIDSDDPVYKYLTNYYKALGRVIPVPPRNRF